MNKVVNAHNEYDGINYLNNVNAFYSMIKGTYRCYWGISSQYIYQLIQYLVHFKREYLKMELLEILLLIMKRLRKQMIDFLCVKYEKKIFLSLRLIKKSYINKLEVKRNCKYFKVTTIKLSKRLLITKIR